MAQAALVVSCDACENDQDAKFYCVNCEMNLCQTCKTIHSKFKTSKNHQVIPISEARDENITKTPVILCGDHSNEEVNFYCKQCHQLICGDCLIGKHKGHDFTTLKEIKNTATDELVNLREKLKSRKVSYENDVKTESKAHSEYMAAIKQCKQDITDQKKTIFAELNSICEEEFKELTILEEKETKRYADACTNIQRKTEVVVSALQTIQNGIDGGHPAHMIKAREVATKSTEGLHDSTTPQLDIPQFKKAKLERPALRQHLGSIYKRPSGAVMTGSRQKSDVKTSYDTRINKHEIDMKNVKIRFTMQVKDNPGLIKVIIPTNNNCTWVSAEVDKNLTLINDKGDTVKTSVTVSDRHIEDAKAYNNDILVTCNYENKVYRLSGNGTTKSTFSDLQPYKTFGLCVTNEMDVLVCLWSLSDKMVVRLGKNGDIIQTIQNDSKGNPLYSLPFRVTSLPSGEILVTQTRDGKVICVDKDGQHLFTWNGKIEGKQIEEYTSWGISHENHNVFVTDADNHKLYALRKDGTATNCLLDNTQGIEKPLGVALDDHGQLLVGCKDGKIHVIKY